MPLKSGKAWQVLNEMNHPFDQDNFESFLSEQADQHRMYAGDRVWRNIQEKLHGKDRWPALTFGSILTTSIIAVVLTFTYPQKRLYNSPADFSAIESYIQPVAKIEPSKEPMVKKANQQVATILAVAPHLSAKVNTGDYPVAMNLQTEEILELYTTDDNENIANLTTSATNISNSENNDANTSLQKSRVSSQSSEYGFYNAELGDNSMNKSLISRINDVGLSFRQVEVIENSIQPNEERNEGIISKQEAISGNNFINSTMAYGPGKPGKTIAGKNRWLLQLYATPSISYRYMLEDKKFIENPTATNGPLAPYLTNPASEFVHHKPKLGLEVGTAFIYQVTDKFRLKTGLQANYRQFGIQAYATYAQPAMLTLNRQNGIDSIIQYSSLSTQGGYKKMELSSNFLQLAIPLGFDMKIADTRSVDFYVSAAGQFTYQLASSYYILSDDYKNYLKQPDIDRKFNINTAIEAFASFEAGGITWQAGPQIRYQLLPGSKDVYPIREHLIDYGFKVGVVKKLK